MRCGKATTLHLLVLIFGRLSTRSTVTSFVPFGYTNQRASEPLILFEYSAMVATFFSSIAEKSILRFRREDRATGTFALLALTFYKIASKSTQQSYQRSRVHAKCLYSQFLMQNLSRHFCCRSVQMSARVLVLTRTLHLRADTSRIR